jgi:hypothetical protein
MAHHVYVFLLVVCLLLSLARPSPPREERPSAARSSVCSSPAHQTIAPPVVSPRQAWNLLLRQYAPGVRSKAAGVFPNA